MTTVRDELKTWVASLRGALEWHVESGWDTLAVPDDFQMPILGQIAPRKPAFVPTAAPRVEPIPVQTPATQAPAPSSEPLPPRSSGADAASELHVLREHIGHCTRCDLHTRRTELIFGWGNPSARLMFLAEAPGRAEDEAGMPFVDPAGLLLGRMIRAMGLRREDVYLTYLVKCHPKGQEPTTEQTQTCNAFLQRQLQIIKPEVLITLGDFASRAVTKTTAAMPRIRGEFFELDEHPGITVMPTFPPIALIQNPNLKATVWDDLKKVMRRLKLPASR